MLLTTGAVGEESPVHTDAQLPTLISSLLQGGASPVRVLHVTHVKPTVHLQVTQVQLLSAVSKHSATYNTHQTPAKYYLQILPNT